MNNLMVIENSAKCGKETFSVCVISGNEYNVYLIKVAIFPKHQSTMHYSKAVCKLNADIVNI